MSSPVFLALDGVVSAQSADLNVWPPVGTVSVLYRDLKIDQVQLKIHDIRAMVNMKAYVTQGTNR